MTQNKRIRRFEKLNTRYTNWHSISSTSITRRAVRFFGGGSGGGRRISGRTQGGGGKKKSNIMTWIHLHDFISSNRPIEFINSTAWVLYKQSGIINGLAVAHSLSIYWKPFFFPLKKYFCGEEEVAVKGDNEAQQGSLYSHTHPLTDPTHHSHICNVTYILVNKIKVISSLFEN